MSIGNYRDGSLAVRSVKMNHGILTVPYTLTTSDQSVLESLSFVPVLMSVRGLSNQRTFMSADWRVS